MLELPDTAAIEQALYPQSLRMFLYGTGAQRIPGVPVMSAWDIVETGNPYRGNWHIDALCEHLQAVSDHEVLRLLVTMPPRMLKSLVVSVAWPAWEWIARPNTRWIFASYAERLAIRDAVKARAIMQHPWYRERWGDRFDFTGDQNVKSYYTNDHGGHRYSLGVHGGATGEGADILAVDDPMNAMDAPTENARDEVLRWWREVMPSRLNDPATGRKVVVMQRLHEDDLAGTCIDAGYTHLNLPNEYDPRRHCVTIRTPMPTTEDPEPEPVQWEDPRTEDRQLLFPSRLGPPQVAQLKDPVDGLGPTAYAGQYNQTPTPDDDSAMFPETGWSYFDDLPRGEDGRYRRPDDTLVSWDMTFKGKGDAGKRRKRGEVDYVVGQFWYRYGASFYLVDQARAQTSFTQACRLVAQFDARCHTLHPFPPSRHVVEDKANGPAVMSQLGTRVGALVPFNPDPYGDKTARAWSQQDVIRMNVWIPRRGAFVPAYVHEFKSFPNGRHDDQVDSTVQAMLAFRRRRWSAE